tara:strand:- start:59 stop:460 length:402 start_codon:yes stop_codon:yes gene_type:complete
MNTLLPVLGFICSCGSYVVSAGLGILVMAVITLGSYFGIRYYLSYKRGKETRFTIREMEITEEWTDDLPKAVHTLYTSKGPVRVSKKVFDELEVGMTYSVHASRWPDDEWHTYGEWKPMVKVDKAKSEEPSDQ